YTATANPGGASCSTGGATGCTVTGLANGTAYTFPVVATNAAGQCSPSAPPAGVPPRTVPGAPILGSVTAGNGTVVLAWLAPLFGGGASITGYTATASPGGLTCATPGLTACTITG